MNGELLWYIFAGLMVLVGTPILTGALLWALSPPRTRLKMTVVLDMVGFLVAILMFAWLLDSGRVKYHEWALWLLLLIGVLGVGILDWLTHKGRER